MNGQKIHDVLKICVASVLFAAIFFSIPGVAEEVIVLVGSTDTKNTYHGRWLELIYSDLFHRLGYELQYDAYPSARASEMSSSGVVDGEINRVSMYGTMHPEVIRVDESHFETAIAAYAVKPGIRVDGWQSLKNKNYKIEYRRATRIVEKALSSVSNPENISIANTVEQGLIKLIRERTDLYIDVEGIVDGQLSLVNKYDFGSSAVYKAGIMERDTLHLYLHKKNASLVPRVANELKVMKQEGLVEYYRREALRD